MGMQCMIQPRSMKKSLEAKNHTCFAANCTTAKERKTFQQRKQKLRGSRWGVLDFSPF
jgi:hypothetical protein